MQGSHQHCSLALGHSPTLKTSCFSSVRRKSHRTFTLCFVKLPGPTKKSLKLKALTKVWALSILLALLIFLFLMLLSFCLAFPLLLLHPNLILLPSNLFHESFLVFVFVFHASLILYFSFLLFCFLFFSEKKTEKKKKEERRISYHRFGWVVFK